MPKYIVHMGVTLRSYGNVEVEAETVEAAFAKLTADYVGENIEITETTTDSGQDLAVIDVTTGDGAEDAEDWGGHPLPSPYDPVDAAPLRALLQKALDDWPEFDGDDDVNGGDLVEWFGNWRDEVKGAIAKPQDAEADLSGPAKEWSGRPDPADPDNFWIDDETGERVNATTGERSLRTFVHTPDTCPSKHWNGGDDICADCGEHLNA